MIEEQYVSFETAKLANEKGFNEYCNSDYCKGLINYPMEDNWWTNSDINYDGRISRPTQSLLARWLREKHNIFIGIIIEPDEGYCYNTKKFSKTFLGWTHRYNRCFLTYEEAMEAGLQEALKLIETEE